MIRMHSAPSPASSPAEKWPNEEKAETRAPGADNEKAPNRRPGLSAFLRGVHVANAIHGGRSSAILAAAARRIAARVMADDTSH